MNTFTLFTEKPWKKNCVEVIEYDGEIRINQGDPQEKPNIANIGDRTQYYSDKF